MTLTYSITSIKNRILSDTFADGRKFHPLTFNHRLSIKFRRTTFFGVLTLCHFFYVYFVPCSLYQQHFVTLGAIHQLACRILFAFSFLGQIVLYCYTVSQENCPTYLQKILQLCHFACGLLNLS
jgi:hypothetical protein